MSMQRIRERYGVPAKRGGRVRYSGRVWHRYGGRREGTITGSTRTSMYLRIRLDGDRNSLLFHPTWALEYLDPDGTSPTVPLRRARLASNERAAQTGSRQWVQPDNAAEGQR